MVGFFMWCVMGFASLLLAAIGHVHHHVDPFWVWVMGWVTGTIAGAGWLASAVNKGP